MTSVDSQVLLDAARLLGTAQRAIKRLAKITACTPEHERKLIAEIMANINAAIARIQTS
jgi:hypothetical protein